LRSAFGNERGAETRAAERGKTPPYTEFQKYRLTEISLLLEASRYECIKNPLEPAMSFPPFKVDILEGPPWIFSYVHGKMIEVGSKLYTDPGTEVIESLYRTAILNSSPVIL